MTVRLPEWRAYCRHCTRRFWTHGPTAPTTCPFCGGDDVMADLAVSWPLPPRRDAA